jgi:hypothetical protein
MTAYVKSFPDWNNPYKNQGVETIPWHNVKLGPLLLENKEPEGLDRKTFKI